MLLQPRFTLLMRHTHTHTVLKYTRTISISKNVTSVTRRCCLNIERGYDQSQFHWRLCSCCICCSFTAEIVSQMFCKRTNAYLRGCSPQSAQAAPLEFHTVIFVLKDTMACSRTVTRGSGFTGCCHTKRKGLLL